MTILPRLVSTQRPIGKVNKLLKSLYGLKQASRQWFNKYSNSLIDLGLIPNLNDFLFHLHKGWDFPSPSNLRGWGIFTAS